MCSTMYKLLYSPFTNTFTDILLIMYPSLKLSLELWPVFSRAESILGYRSKSDDIRRCVALLFWNMFVEILLCQISILPLKSQITNLKNLDE